MSLVAEYWKAPSKTEKVEQNNRTLCPPKAISQRTAPRKACCVAADFVTGCAFQDRTPRLTGHRNNSQEMVFQYFCRRFY
jgi:hypothetical protein